jgi:hypothetical protein
MASEDAWRGRGAARQIQSFASATVLSLMPSRVMSVAFLSEPATSK